MPSAPASPLAPAAEAPRALPRSEPSLAPVSQPLSLLAAGAESLDALLDPALLSLSAAAPDALTLALEDPALGRLDLRLELQREAQRPQLTVQLQADPALSASLRQALPGLASALRAEGLTLGPLSEVRSRPASRRGEAETAMAPAELRRLRGRRGLDRYA
ncbi:MAG TPA: flagellar hook-length control protein FliK [Nevskiaceae bacterium]|nr:flagellar hook-length control protein FliK [Nevskiaceae bacterium]